MMKKWRNLKDNLKHIQIKNLRIRVIKGINLFLGATLLIRVFFIQHVYSDAYLGFLHKDKLKTEAYKKSSLRGNIYDRNGTPLVTNTPILSLIYRYDTQKSTESLYDIAEQIATLIDIDVSNLRQSQLEHLYRRLNQIDDSIDVSKEELETLTETDLKAEVIFNLMADARFGGENTIKANLSAEEQAIITENLAGLDGIDVVYKFVRDYPENLQIEDVVGKLNPEDKGLPFDQFHALLNAGYTVNDPLGTSGLEHEYETFLKGAKGYYEKADGADEVEIFSGFNGANLTLTLDHQLHLEINSILERYVKSARKNVIGASYLNEGYVVVSDPNNEEILSLNGIKLDKDGKINFHPLGTFHNSFTMGSVVKGASMLAGYHYGVTNFGDTVEDTPMIFADGTKKGSWMKLGFVNDIDALRRSSNVYFMLQAINLGGGYYFPKANLHVDLNKAWTTYRRFFEQFGLGMPTGVDLSYEQVGLKTTDKSIAKLLDLVIGQSDTYTTLQLAQYVSTIANGGTRYETKLVKEAFHELDADSKLIFHEFAPTVLNVVDLPKEAFGRVQEGFRQALQTSGGTGHHIMGGKNYQPAGKTGTAEEFACDYEGNLIWQGSQLIPVHHTTFVGYAPHDNPEIAIAVVFPQSEQPKKQNPIALQVADEVFRAYFKLKAKK